MEHKSKRVAFLDRTIPLRGASHAEVLEYSVDIPTRYAQVCARLADGRTVRLRDSKQFVGWSGWTGKRSFLFRSGRHRIEIQADAGLPIGTDRSGFVSVISWLLFLVRHSETPVHNHAARKFIAPDGSQLVVRHWGQVFPRRIGRRARIYNKSVLDSRELVGAA
jgi:hypothetical protein